MENITRRKLVKVVLATTVLLLLPKTILAKTTTPTYYIHKEFKKHAQVDLDLTLKNFNMGWCKVEKLVSNNYNYNYNYKSRTQGKVSHNLEVKNGISKYYIEGIEVVLKPSERVTLEMI